MHKVRKRAGGPTRATGARGGTPRAPKLNNNLYRNRNRSTGPTTVKVKPRCATHRRRWPIVLNSGDVHRNRCECEADPRTQKLPPRASQSHPEPKADRGAQRGVAELARMSTASEYSLPKGYVRSPVAQPRFEPEPSTTISLGESLLGDGPAMTSTKSTSTAAFFNLINNYVGMVLLSMHFTFARSGWLALPMLALLTGFGAFTGDCIVASYQKIQADNPRRCPSYAEIGARCLGPFGKWLVVVSSLIENLVATLCMLIIIWTNSS